MSPTTAITATTIWATVPNLTEVSSTSASWVVSPLGGSRSGASGWAVQGGAELVSPSECDESGIFVFGVELCRVLPNLIVRGPLAQFHTALPVIRGEDQGRDSSQLIFRKCYRIPCIDSQHLCAVESLKGELSFLYAALMARTKFPGYL